MRNVAKHWISAVSGMASLVSLYAGLSGKGPGASWLWIVIAYAALAFGLSFEWYKDHRSARAGRALYDALASRHQALTLAWTELDNLYRNTPKDEHAPKTLPDPMESRQIGDLEFRFRIGVLQAKTYQLLDDLTRIGIDIGYANVTIRSVPELLRVLERCNSKPPFSS